MKAVPPQRISLQLTVPVFNGNRSRTRTFSVVKQRQPNQRTYPLVVEAANELLADVHEALKQ